PRAGRDAPTGGPRTRRISDRRPTSERELQFFTGCGLWWATTLTIEIVSFVPTLLPENAAFWRLSLGVPAVLIGLSYLTWIPRLSERAQDRWLFGFSFLGAILLLLVLQITPASWAIMMGMLAPVIWAGYFLSLRLAAFIAGSTTLFVLSPLVVDYGGDDAHTVSRLAVFIPAIWVTMFGLHWQKRTLKAEQRHAADLAYVDPLTGLANVRALRERFEELRRCPGEADRIGLLLLDIDNFKSANTRYGHVGGDHALRCVAHQLRRAAASDHLVARIGGDEFAVLIPGADAGQTAEMTRFYRGIVLAADSELGLPGVTLDACVGAAAFPADGRTLEDLLTVADTSMYGEKKRRAKKNPVRPTASPTATTAALTAAQRPTWLSEDTDHAGLDTGRSWSSRLWHDRSSFVRFASSVWVAGSSTVLVALLVPDADRTNATAMYAISGGGLLFALAIFIFNPREHGLIHTGMDAVALVVLTAAVYLSGGANSPVLPLVVVLAVYQGWFMGVSSINWRMLGPTVIVASPVVYDSALGR
ncbi:MAG: GGDEF domain-containing protein, partial [Solirubrobacterales bacterium]